MPESAELKVFIRMRDEFSRQFKKFQKDVGTGSRQIEQKTKPIASGFAKIGTAIKGAVAAYIGWVGIQKAYNATKDYAKLESVRIGFENLSKDVGISADAIGRWREAVRATIGDVDLLEHANKLLIAGVIKTEEEFTAVSTAAFMLARATGQQVLPALQQMTAALAGASPRALRQLGVDMETIWRQQRDITGEELPLEIKQRTMLVALVNQMKAGFGDLAKIQETTAENIQQAETHWGNVSENIGAVFTQLVTGNEMLSATLEKLSEALGKATGAIKTAREWTLGGRDTEAQRKEGSAESSRRNREWLDQQLRLRNRTPAAQNKIPDWRRHVPWFKYGMTDISGTEASRDFRLLYKYSEGEAYIPEQEEPTQIEKMWKAAGEAVKKYKETVGDAMLATEMAVTNSLYATERIIGDVFFDGLTGKMKSFKEYLKSFLEDIADALSNLAAKMAVMGIIQGVGGAVGSLFGPGSATGLSPSQVGLTDINAPSAGRSLDALWATNMGTARQHGGPVYPGELYRVNELRTEYFRPNVGGQVLPLAPAGAVAGGGGNITINFAPTIHAVDTRGMRQALHPEVEWLADRIANTNRNLPLHRALYGIKR